MESWIDFGRGPLFRFAFVVMVLGLLRSVLLSLLGMNIALHRAGDRVLPWKDLWRNTFRWLLPVTRLFTRRPLYSTISFLWHIGLILVPLTLAAHARLFWMGTDIDQVWPVVPQSLADTVTLVTIMLGILLFFGRVASRESRFLSRFQDFFWVPILTFTFLTGWLCTTQSLGASSYQLWMLLHVFSADLVLFLIPFTKVAHCVLMPISQFVSATGWKFPRGAGERVASTLGKEGMPV